MANPRVYCEGAGVKSNLHTPAIVIEVVKKSAIVRVVKDGQAVIARLIKVDYCPNDPTISLTADFDTFLKVGDEVRVSKLSPLTTNSENRRGVYFHAGHACRNTPLKSDHAIGFIKELDLNNGKPIPSVVTATISDKETHVWVPNEDVRINGVQWNMCGQFLNKSTCCVGMAVELTDIIQCRHNRWKYKAKANVLLSLNKPPEIVKPTQHSTPSTNSHVPVPRTNNLTLKVRATTTMPELTPHKKQVSGKGSSSGSQPSLSVPSLSSFTDNERSKIALLSNLSRTPSEESDLDQALTFENDWRNLLLPPGQVIDGVILFVHKSTRVGVVSFILDNKKYEALFYRDKVTVKGHHVTRSQAYKCKLAINVPVKVWKLDSNRNEKLRYKLLASIDIDDFSLMPSCSSDDLSKHNQSLSSTVQVGQEFVGQIVNYSKSCDSPRGLAEFKQGLSTFLTSFVVTRLQVGKRFLDGGFFQSLAHIGMKIHLTIDETSNSDSYSFKAKGQIRLSIDELQASYFKHKSENQSLIKKATDMKGKHKGTIERIDKNMYGKEYPGIVSIEVKQKKQLVFIPAGRVSINGICLKHYQNVKLPKYVNESALIIVTNLLPAKPDIAITSRCAYEGSAAIWSKSVTVLELFCATKKVNDEQHTSVSSSELSEQVSQHTSRNREQLLVSPFHASLSPISSLSGSYITTASACEGLSEQVSQHMSSNRDQLSASPFHSSLSPNLSLSGSYITTTSTREGFHVVESDFEDLSEYMCCSSPYVTKGKSKATSAISTDGQQKLIGREVTVDNPKQDTNCRVDHAISQNCACCPYELTTLAPQQKRIVHLESQIQKCVHQTPEIRNKTEQSTQTISTGEIITFAVFTNNLTQSY